MQPLLDHLASFASCVNIDLNDSEWYTHWDIPNIPGWYFIRTDTPLDVLQRQTLWSPTYITVRKKKLAKTKNIDIAGYAARYSEALAHYWNISEVYSGMASTLRDRAKQHTFPDAGTGGLALGRYDELRQYNWTFGFMCLDRLACVAGRTLTDDQADMLLHFGEQVWRTANGWPLLCKQ